MTTSWQDAARAACDGADAGTMSFPEIVQSLIAAGCDGYSVDFRRAAQFHHSGGQQLCCP